MTWSVQQEAALAAVKAWLNDKHAPQVFRLFGFAGTGKTTIMKELREMAGGNVVYGAFTGKAALVLERKGCFGARTIHRLIYKCDEDMHGRPTFHLDWDSDVRHAKVIGLDECSMIGPEMGADLLKFGVKILVIGDPAQLPPVKGAGFFTSDSPDFLLTEIHRQAADNPIIRMSMNIREGRGLAYGSYGESRVLRMSDAAVSDITDVDQRIVGTNAVRRQWNRQMRGLLGFTTPGVPAVNDRVICLRNNHEHGLLNGSIWNVTAFRKTVFDQLALTVVSEEGDRTVSTTAWPQPFMGTEFDIGWRARNEYDEFDFGYAITAHKAQGSQWNNVTIKDESHVFREDAQRWLYTAVTRAAERVTVLR